jgi:hypothetical protein
LRFEASPGKRLVRPYLDKQARYIPVIPAMQEAQIEQDHGPKSP